jgi:voltage-gated potassium channel
MEGQLKDRQIHRRLLERRLEIATILAALATVPVTIAQTQGVEALWIQIGDWAIWLVFAIEYTALMIVSDNRLQTTRKHWLSVFIIVFSFPLLPAVFGATRLARLLRLVRLVRLLVIADRGRRAFKAVFAQNELIYVAGVTTFLVFVAAAILTLVEPQKGGFWQSLWWAIVTATTVGYGDITPESLPGRITAVFLMLAGIGLVATLAAALASYFVGDAGRDQKLQISDLQDRLERIEKLLLEQREATPSADTDD